MFNCTIRSFVTLNLLLLLGSGTIRSQNLIIDGSISNNVNWNGQEAPWNATTFENSYLTGACNANYVMEVDNASSPQQVVTGFIPSAVYVLSYRYAFRNSGCAPSVTPTVIQFQFTDATGTLTYTQSILSTQNTLVGNQMTFTNNAATTHTLRITNPGNANTCGVILDDISIVLNATPGGVGAGNCTMWLNASTINQPNNTNLLGWLSQGSNNIPFTPPCANPPVFRTGLATAANGLVANFNPYVSFNGANQYLHYVSAKIDLYLNTAGGEGGTYFAVYQGGGNNLTYFGSRCLNDSRTWARTNRYIYPNGAGAGTNNEANYTQSTRVNLATMRGKSNGLTISDRNGTTIPNTNNSADIDFLTVGVRRNLAGTYSEYFNGSLSEIIIFNTLLSNTETQQVRSYLASKYGVTLTDNTSTAGLDERNYLSSNTTTYWSYPTNSTYHNNVTVIGRDDASQLNQRRSISTDADATGVAGGNAMLILDNVSAISSSNSFLAAGHDNVAGNTQELVDVPAGIQVRMRRVWKFQKTNGGVANNINAIFDLTGYAPITGANLRLLVSTTPSFTGATIIAGAYAAPYFTASLPTTGGVYFTVASTNSVATPLPVELLSFNAEAEPKQVRLNWTTATENNNKKFDIERSSDGLNFETISIVDSKAKNGSSQNPIDYSIEDLSPLEGVSYYRLRQVNLDNSSVLSHIVSVNYSKEKNIQFTVYPNPNKGEFIADVSGIENNHEVTLLLHDSQGKLVYKNNFYMQDQASSKFNIHPEIKLANGIYTCTLLVEEIAYPVKVVVN
jgi:hypothetical protein